MKKALSLLLVLVSAQASLAALSVDRLETWNATNTAGWTAYDAINQAAVSALTVQSNALKLSFPSQSIPAPPEQYQVRAPAPFTGDYLAQGIMAISFRLFPQYNSTVQLAFRNDLTGQTWRYKIPNLVTAQWQTVTVSVDPATLTHFDGPADMAAFKAALQNVTWMGLIVTRHSSLNAQYTRVDDFRLYGAGSDYATWIAALGSGSTLPGSDMDGDGISNYGEWVAGTSASNPSDVLQIDRTDLTSARKGLILRWDSVAGRRYRVMRTDSLTVPFARIGEDVPATPPQNVFEDTTATNETPRFYKLEVVQ